MQGKSLSSNIEMDEEMKEKLKLMQEELEAN
jgi:hypothetical protein